MASSTLFNTSTPTLGDVFANGKTFVVPRYQRDYSWEEDQWEELWSDLYRAHQENTDHYMGALVLQDTGDRKVFTIIDGQQRLVTISLLALAGLKFLQTLADSGIESEKNVERVRLTRERFLQVKDAATLLNVARLKLNRNNDPFFSGTLVQLKEPLAPKKLNASDRLLWQCFRYFSKKIDEQFKEKDKGEDLARLVNRTLADRFLFIQILVDDDLNAYMVFETLNARGTRLTATDLVKNYVMSQFSSSDSDLDIIEQRWHRILGAAQAGDFSLFLRHHWNSQHDLVRRQELFKAVKRSVSNQDEAQSFLEGVESSAHVHAALQRWKDEFWGGDKGIQKRVRELLIFGVTQCYPVLYSAHTKLAAHFEEILRICAVLSFRYIVIGRLNAQPMERAYSSVAVKVWKGEITTPRQIFDALKDLYVPDEQFKSHFSSASIDSGSKKSSVRYILFQIENHLAGGTALDFEDDSATLEHIYPENPNENWDGVFSDGAQEVYRLGNYLLLEEKLNRDAANKSFDEKKVYYRQSKYQLAKRLSANAWNHDSLVKHQEFLADQATAVWRLGY